MRRAIPRLTLCAALVLVPAARADRLITRNGRIIEGVIEDRGDHLLLTLHSGQIEVSKKLVREWYTEGDMSRYKPRNDAERERIAKGWVLFEGKWLSRRDYERKRKLRLAELKARLADLEAHNRIDRGYERTTRHFRLKTNTTPELADHYAELMEDLYAMVHKYLKVKPRPELARRKMLVRIHKDREDYYAYSGPPGTGGYFSPGEESLNLYHSFEDPNYTQNVLFHEATHLMTYLLNDQCHALSWINEGLAEYFGSAKIDVRRGKRTLTPGQVLDGRLIVMQQLMRDGEYKRLKDWLYDEKSYSYIDYPHWWSFVHFLASSKKYRRGFWKFVQNYYHLRGVKKTSLGGWNKSGVAFHVSAEDCASFLMKMLRVRDLDTLEKEWIEFTLALQPQSGRGYFFNGRDLHQRGKHDEAIANLDKAEAAGYRTAELYYYRSQCYQAKSGWKKAAEDLGRAIALDPLNSRYRGDLSRLQRTALDQPEKGLVQLRLACELSPDDPWLQTRLESWLEERGGSGAAGKHKKNP